MSLAVFNGTAIRGSEAAARAACLERHRACRDMAEVETGGDGRTRRGVQLVEVRGAAEG